MTNDGSAHMRLSPFPGRGAAQVGPDAVAAYGSVKAGVAVPSAEVRALRLPKGVPSDRSIPAISSVCAELYRVTDASSSGRLMRIPPP
jgi:hypothetical protein